MLMDLGKPTQVKCLMLDSQEQKYLKPPIRFKNLGLMYVYLSDPEKSLQSWLWSDDQLSLLLEFNFQN